MKKEKEQPQPKKGRGRPTGRSKPKTPLTTYAEESVAQALDKACEAAKTTRSALLGRWLVEKLRADGYLTEKQ